MRERFEFLIFLIRKGGNLLVLRTYERAGKLRLESIPASANQINNVGASHNLDSDFVTRHRRLIQSSFSTKSSASNRHSTIMSRVALVTSVAHVFVGVGHTVRTTQRRVSILTANKVFGLGMFSNPKWSSVPSLLYAYARVGWYQGSLFFTIAGMSVSSLEDPNRPFFHSLTQLSFRPLHLPTVPKRPLDLVHHRPDHLGHDPGPLLGQQCLVL